MELLRDYREALLPEYLFHADDRIVRPEPGIVEVYRLRRHAPPDERLLHVLRLVVTLAAVVAADDQVLHFAGMIQCSGRIDPVVEIRIRTSRTHRPRSPEQQPRPVGGHLPGRGVYPAVCRPLHGIPGGGYRHGSQHRPGGRRPCHCLQPFFHHRPQLPRSSDR